MSTSVGLDRLVAAPGPGPGRWVSERCDWDCGVVVCADVRGTTEEVKGAIPAADDDRDSRCWRADVVDEKMGWVVMDGGGGGCSIVVVLFSSVSEGDLGAWKVGGAVGRASWFPFVVLRVVVVPFPPLEKEEGPTVVGSVPPVAEWCRFRFEMYTTQSLPAEKQLEQVP